MSAEERRSAGTTAPGRTRCCQRGTHLVALPADVGVQAAELLLQLLRRLLLLPQPRRLHLPLALQQRPLQLRLHSTAASGRCPSPDGSERGGHARAPGPLTSRDVSCSCCSSSLRRLLSWSRRPSTPARSSSSCCASLARGPASSSCCGEGRSAQHGVAWHGAARRSMAWRSTAQRGHLLTSWWVLSVLLHSSFRFSSSDRSRLSLCRRTPGSSAARPSATAPRGARRPASASAARSRCTSAGSVPSVLVYSAQRFRMVSRRCRSCGEEQSAWCPSRHTPLPERANGRCGDAGSLCALTTRWDRLGTSQIPTQPLQPPAKSWRRANYRQQRWLPRVSAISRR